LKVTENIAASAIGRELDSDEKLLWTDVPDPRRMMVPTIPIWNCLAVLMNAYSLIFIFYTTPGGRMQNVQGPGGLLEGVLTWFLILSIALGLGTLICGSWER
jgi:hypothetical protein